MNQAASISGVKYLLEKYQLYPKKRWGQNFLVDKNILHKIVDAAGLKEDQYVVEIGPGLGALTKQLAARSKGVLAIDVDASLQAPLTEILAGDDNIRLVFADILKVDIEQELQKAFGLAQPPLYQVCANIPYNITSPIIFKLLEKSSHLKRITLMMQKEVASRILASPGNKNYGLLTLMVAYYAQARLVTNVSRNCFYPRPEVDSSVIEILPLTGKRVVVADEKLFKQFMRAAFQKRRKTILNIYSGFFNIPKDEAATRLKQTGIAPASRPENLTIEDFALLTDRYSS